MNDTPNGPRGDFGGNGPAHAALPEATGERDLSRRWYASEALGPYPGPARWAEPEEAPWNPREHLGRRIAFSAMMVVLALISFFVVAKWASSAESYTGTIQALDEKKATVMRLVGASSGASAGITLLPGDVGTPIAEKLIDLSSDFLVVISALYLEKYMLTILGMVSFRILVPAACIMAAIVPFADPRRSLRHLLTQWAFRVGVFGLAICLIVPSSIAVSRMIENTYSSSINATVAAAEQTTEQIQELNKDQNNDIIGNIVSSVTGGVSGLIAKAESVLNDFVESLAVMVVTSCVIPILVLLFFLWLTRVLLGVELPTPSWRPRSTRSLRKGGGGLRRLR